MQVLWTLNDLLHTHNLSAHVCLSSGDALAPVSTRNPRKTQSLEITHMHAHTHTHTQEQLCTRYVTQNDIFQTLQYVLNTIKKQICTPTRLGSSGLRHKNLSDRPPTAVCRSRRHSCSSNFRHTNLSAPPPTRTSFKESTAARAVHVRMSPRLLYAV